MWSCFYIGWYGTRSLCSCFRYFKGDIRRLCLCAFVKCGIHRSWTIGVLMQQVRSNRLGVSRGCPARASAKLPRSAAICRVSGDARSLSRAPAYTTSYTTDLTRASDTYYFAIVTSFHTELAKSPSAHATSLLHERATTIKSSGFHAASRRRRTGTGVLSR